MPFSGIAKRPGKNHEDCQHRNRPKVLVVPVYQTPTGIEFEELHEVQLWLRALVETFERAGRLNKIAAIWTAIAVALGGVASVVSALAT
jgi:hypothetical protein